MSSMVVAGARIDAVREFCAAAIEHDKLPNSNALTDRAWCAQGVLNILDGNVDWQLGTSGLCIVCGRDAEPGTRYCGGECGCPSGA